MKQSLGLGETFTAIGLHYSESCIFCSSLELGVDGARLCGTIGYLILESFFIFILEQHLRLVRSILPPWRRRCFINHTPHTNTTMAESCWSSCLHLPLPLQFLLHFCNCYLVLLVPHASTSPRAHHLGHSFSCQWFQVVQLRPHHINRTRALLNSKREKRTSLSTCCFKKEVIVTYIWVPDLQYHSRSSRRELSRKHFHKTFRAENTIMLMLLKNTWPNTFWTREFFVASSMFRCWPRLII